jgi:glyoxylase-like metal-dependent hydrolase (beta-lactamase superfamily II)
MKICDGIYIVASGDAGYALSDPYDCSVYLIGGGSELALIDTGAGIQPEQFMRLIKAEGFNPTDIKYALLTHGHADHSGGAYFLHQHCGTEILASSQTARFVSEGDEDAISLRQAKRAGAYPAGYTYHACPVTPMPDGATISAAGFSIKLIETPGHADGHACYLMEHDGKRMLFSGDLVFWGGKIILQQHGTAGFPNTPQYGAYPRTPYRLAAAGTPEFPVEPRI